MRYQMRWLSRTVARIAVGAVLLMPVPAMAAYRRAVVRNPIAVRPHSVVVRPFIRPYAPVIVRPYVRPYPYFYYGPGWYGYPYRYPGGYYSFRPAYATGEVKIDTNLKDASLYIDSGYVGPIDKFKKFDLSPGNHEIELRDAFGRTVFRETVQVLVDKTVKIKIPE